jgi:hypothetical protein
LFEWKKATFPQVPKKKMGILIEIYYIIIYTVENYKGFSPSWHSLSVCFAQKNEKIYKMLKFTKPKKEKRIFFPQENISDLFFSELAICLVNF